MLFRVLGCVCGVLFVGLLWVSFLYSSSLFPFSIKLLLSYQNNNNNNNVDGIF